VSNHLARQRIRYLVEHGGLYHYDEPANKNFVVKWALIAVALHMAIDYVMVMLR
jgi:hypothetical protein